ncbi:deoxyhypusine synthase-like [Diadema antillarum]|uniref:deoxyhypusine synthase-like n=1 Tax=Diadema antillarum TaxID=105358 RepID=UPI003A8739D7
MAAVHRFLSRLHLIRSSGQKSSTLPSSLSSTFPCFSSPSSSSSVFSAAATSVKDRARRGTVIREMPECVNRDAEENVAGATSREPVTVKGHDFAEGIDHQAILSAMQRTGFQATNFATAVEEINKMLNKRAEPLTNEEPERRAACGREISNCTIFLGYTSSIITSGLREVICFLAKHNLVDCIVTTAGGIEEDFIKCFGDYYLASFEENGEELFNRRLNRAGNLLIPESLYYHFTDFLQPVLEDMMNEQENHGFNWTPSKMIARMGKEINEESSVYYWAYKNNIPVFCPALTDGGLGDELLYFKQRNPGRHLRVDISEDIVRIIRHAQDSYHTGIVTAGGGVAKHHICNSNAHREPAGADYAVYLNTGHEFDGSDSGARTEEAVSWGKIKPTANAVKIHGEASLLLPFLVAETFAKLVYPPDSN